MRLHALTGGQLRSFERTGRADVDGQEVGWPDDDRRTLGYRVEALDADPAAAPWLVHVLLDEAVVAARIGCHAGPEDGTVEIGYYVSPTRRGRGLATALVTEFLGWLREHGVTTVRATVSPDNSASRAILSRQGFVEVGEQWDDEDGRELVLERGLSDWSAG